MTATDELRRMLTEAGVEWTDCSYKDTCTAWSSNGITWYGLWRDGSIELLAHHLTPAQAVAATICDTDATPTRQGDADLAAENAKLRELAAGIGHLLFVLDVDYCVACPRDDINHPCPVYTVKGGECLYKTDLRKLGVEV